MHTQLTEQYNAIVRVTFCNNFIEKKKREREKKEKEKRTKRNDGTEKMEGGRERSK